MKTKILLPVLAIVLTVAMSFAFVNTTAEEYYAPGFIQIGTEWYEVDVACTSSAPHPCEVQIQGQTQSYQVYADESTSRPLKSSTPDVKIVPDPR